MAWGWTRLRLGTGPLSRGRWLARGIGSAVCFCWLISLWALPVQPALASPGLCVGPVCGDQISRSAKHHFQLRLRLTDQQGHRERVLVDCRTGTLSPLSGPVERGYASALARRACRLPQRMDATAAGRSSSPVPAPG